MDQRFRCGASTGGNSATATGNLLRMSANRVEIWSNRLFGAPHTL
jgi:hypothetical protein